MRATLFTHFMFYACHCFDGAMRYAQDYACRYSVVDVAATTCRLLFSRCRCAADDDMRLFYARLTAATVPRYAVTRHHETLIIGGYAYAV